MRPFCYPLSTIQSFAVPPVFTINLYSGVPLKNNLPVDGAGKVVPEFKSTYPFTNNSFKYTVCDLLAVKSVILIIEEPKAELEIVLAEPPIIEEKLAEELMLFDFPAITEEYFEEFVLPEPAPMKEK